ncbi:MAG: hypothetical protein A3G18_07520 [Rhodospirillales bacterium RIFCSPLOWO2_12_FULL_58_28]|nr:MAG: hypothetical protein A3H92_08995 [Rhodospirillales bacterium RIFCSPLOWO2_02_FULL_58_16]OHC77571.1 MAG: hypothetical protein A3G18_07520 [Rhodospirillales bacterium RIFCSPLOWO2_12_FULL_58_28]
MRDEQTIVGSKELSRTDITGASQATLAESVFIQLYRIRIGKWIAGYLAQYPIAAPGIGQYQRGAVFLHT